MTKCGLFFKLKMMARPEARTTIQRKEFINKGSVAVLSKDEIDFSFLSHIDQLPPGDLCRAYVTARKNLHNKLHNPLFSTSESEEFLTAKISAFRIAIEERGFELPDVSFSQMPRLVGSPGDYKYQYPPFKNGKRKP